MAILHIYHDRYSLNTMFLPSLSGVMWITEVVGPDVHIERLVLAAADHFISKNPKARRSGLRVGRGIAFLLAALEKASRLGHRIRPGIMGALLRAAELSPVLTDEMQEHIANASMALLGSLAISDLQFLELRHIYVVVTNEHLIREARSGANPPLREPGRMRDPLPEYEGLLEAALAATARQRTPDKSL